MDDRTDPPPSDPLGVVFANLSDEELVETVASAYKNKKTGASEAAHAELTRRAMEAYRIGTQRLATALDDASEQGKSLTRLTWALVGVTIALLAVAIVQLVKT
jgi:CHASE3 domain sensor protein